MLLTPFQSKAFRGSILRVQQTRQQDVPRVNRTNVAKEVICGQITPLTVEGTNILQSSVLPAPLPQKRAIPQPLITDPPLAYDILQGSLVRHCEISKTKNSVPTIVLVHGILGSKKNLRAFARRLLEGYPSWQAILVDLRYHGESQLGASRLMPAPNNVQSAARDILQLLNYLKVFPTVLIGHSFGGKVVMSMAEQFGRTLPRPVQAWVLDTLPGEVRNDNSLGQDHPFDLIKTLQSVPLPIMSRSQLIDILVSNGFSKSIAAWMTTNLIPIDQNNVSRGFTWSFDLEAIEEMYKSYEESNFWSFLASPPEGLKLDFVRAENSNFRWAGHNENAIQSLGHKVHLLQNSGHWVHADNPEGLFHILKQSLGEEEFGLARSISS